MGRGISSLNTKKVAYCVRLKEHREEESINASSFKFDGLSGHQNKSSHLFFHLCGRRIHILLAKIIAQEPPFFLLRESLPVMEMRRWNNLMNVEMELLQEMKPFAFIKKRLNILRTKNFLVFYVVSLFPIISQCVIIVSQSLPSVSRTTELVSEASLRLMAWEIV